MTVIMCAWCGKHCGDDAYAYDAGYPFCAESCFEAWRDQVAEDEEAQ